MVCDPIYWTSSPGGLISAGRLSPVPGPTRPQELFAHVARPARAPRPYTFVVMAMLIVILGVLAIVRMPTDIFPDIDIPVISVDLELRAACRPRRWRSASSRNYERVLTTTVNDIEHIESQSLNGVARHQDLLPAGREASRRRPRR